MKIYDPRRDGRLQPMLPHGLLDMAVAGLGLLIILVALGSLAPGWFQDARLAAGEPPMATVTTPPWYWLPLLGFFKLLPGAWGMTAAVLLTLGLAALPFWERGPRLPLRQRPLFLKLLVLALGGWLGLLLWGVWEMIP